MNPPLVPRDRKALAAWLSPPLLGMVHLPPLPGSPLYGGDPDQALTRALADVQALVEAGFAGVVVENYGDTPFSAGDLPPVTIASMAAVVARLRQRWPDLRLVVNGLRNDAVAALSIAVAAGADGIRVNVHTGAMLTDQGLITGRADRTLRLRRELDSPAWILADLRVKHAAPLAPRPLVDEALDLRERGLADAILLTGSGTGRPAEFDQARELRAAMPDTPLLVASGVTAKTAAQWAALVDGAIVGSELMHGGHAGAGVDPRRARALMDAWMEAPASSEAGS